MTRQWKISHISLCTVLWCGIMYVETHKLKDDIVIVPPCVISNMVIQQCVNAERHNTTVCTHAQYKVGYQSE